MVQPLQFTFLLLRGQTVLAIDAQGQLWLGRFPQGQDSTINWERVTSTVVV